MSAVCVLTPVVIASWPAMSAAVVGVAGPLGFSVVPIATVRQRRQSGERVVTEIEGSEVLEEAMGEQEKIVIRRDDAEIEFSRDERGALRLCVTGKGSKAELDRLGREVAGRVVQQFAYHRLMTELKARDFGVVEEHVGADQSINVRVRLNR